MPTRKRRSAKRPRHTVTDRESTRVLPTVAKSTLLAFAVTLGVGLLLLTLTTAILLSTKDPNRYHDAAGLILLYLTATLGGALCVKFYGRRAPLLCGMTQGLCLLLFFTLAALFLPSSGGNKALALLLRLLVVPAALLGATLASRKKKPRRHH